MYKRWGWKATGTCPSSGIKAVGGAVGACSGLLAHRLLLNAHRHDMCDADRNCRKADDVWREKKRKCESKEVIGCLQEWFRLKLCACLRVCLSVRASSLSCPELCVWWPQGAGAAFSPFPTTFLGLLVGGSKLLWCQIQGGFHCEDFDVGFREAFRPMSLAWWGLMDD